MNDTPATAETLAVGDYYGHVFGTTVGSVISPVFPGWGAHVAWYTFTALAAGSVFLYVRPDDPDLYVEVYAVSKAPTDITEADMGAYGHTDSSYHRPCIFTTIHPSGPLTLMVITYDPDVGGFTFGWGHSLDVVADHWGGVYEQSWARSSTDNTKTITSLRMTAQTMQHDWRGYASTTTPLSIDPDPPPDPTAVAAAYEAARHGGSVDPPGHGSSTPYYLDVGAGRYTEASTSYDFFSSPPNTRTDAFWVYQSHVVWRVPQVRFGAFDMTTEPGGFYTRTSAGGDLDANGGLNWGYLWQAAAWKTGPLTVTYDVTEPSVTDTPVTKTPATPALYVADPNLVHILSYTEWNTERAATWDHEGNWAEIDTAALQLAFISPESLDELAALGTWGDTNTIEITDVSRLFFTPPDSPGSAWYLWLVTADQRDVAGGDAPPIVDPGADASYWTDSISNTRIRDYTAPPVGEVFYEYAQPDWKLYVGFPLPRLGGWHVGRVGAGGLW